MDSIINQRLLNRSDDDPSDHLGSQSATPSGVRTPRPDPQDKRLPGINHAFFGQVGNNSPTDPNCTDSTIMENERSNPSLLSQALAVQALPTAPSSPNEDLQGNGEDASQISLGKRLGNIQLVDELRRATASAYPTPPRSSSSSSSLPQKERKPHDAEFRSRECSLEDGEAGHSGEGDRRPTIDSVPLSARRNTAGIQSLSGIVTSSSVHAHISNPTSDRASTTPSTPTHEKRSSALSLLAASLEMAKLTGRQQKSTPPLTPRALSSSGIENARKSPTTVVEASKAIHEIKINGSTNASSLVGPVRGKLFVRISEARGLRPSQDPYIVCVFEWNEYISRGPKFENAVMEDGDHKTRADLLGGVPIKRGNSDMGRPVAIPMKSRQSSTTSLNEPKPFKSDKPVTDPKWDHDATL